MKNEEWWKKKLLRELFLLDLSAAAGEILINT
jgi:hypothetical protein